MIVHIFCKDENIQKSTQIMDKNSTVNDLFTRFKGKIKHLNPNLYYFKELRSKDSNSIAGYDIDPRSKILTNDTDLPLHINMKLIHLKYPYLELVKKKYMDSPKKKINDGKGFSNKKNDISKKNYIYKQPPVLEKKPEMETIKEEKYINNNKLSITEKNKDDLFGDYTSDALAIKHEEFEVLKTNEMNKKQKRLLGINGNK